MKIKKYFKDKIVVITGASSGIGRQLVKTAHDYGAKVYGISRESFAENGITFLKCDIRNREDVVTIISAILKAENRIDILINNAGMGISGAVENAPFEDIDTIIDTNLKGTVNLTKAVLPSMRECGQGKIINLSSVAAIFPIPCQAFYSATKSAILLFSESLYLEMKPFGVQVMTVMPGDVKTPFTQNRIKHIQDSPYKKRETMSVAAMEKDEENGMSANYVAKKILSKAKKRNMPPEMVIGNIYKFLLFIARFFPKRFTLWLISKLY